MNTITASVCSEQSAAPATDSFREPSHSTEAKTVELDSVPGVKIQRILVPTDFSMHSEKAIRYAGAFAKQFGAQVTLLHVIEPAVLGGEFGYVELDYPTYSSDVSSRLESLITKHVGTAQTARTKVRNGAPYAEIAGEAAEMLADLIIVTTHGRTGLAHVLVGSTAERVVRHAPCPVLVLRDREPELLTTS